MATDILSFDLQKTIRLIPGYDPFAQAGDCVFREDLATHAIGFIEDCCTHVKGPLGGQPLLLSPWEKAIFGNLWGWYRPNGTRRYREAFIFVPRGNAKTTMAAAAINIELYLSNEPGAELYSAASERDQARLCFEIVTGMIRNEPLMEELAQVYKYSVVVGDKSYKALSAEAGSKHGFNVQLLVNDELHAHKTPELTETLMTGMGKRSQPLAIHLTTSDYEREGSICNQKYDYACRVRDNGGDPQKPGYDPAFLPVIYEASKEDDWTDPAVWAKANPGLGVSVPLEYIERECKRAQEDPSYENTFKRLHLNIRTQAVSAWLKSGKWDACCDKSVTIADFAGKECWLAVDTAASEDFNAAVFVFRDDDFDWSPKEDPIVAAHKASARLNLPADTTDSEAEEEEIVVDPSARVAIFPYFWVPRETAESRERQHRIPYSVWEASGHLTLSDDPVIGASLLRTDIRAIIDEHKLHVVEMPVDRAFQGLDLILGLVEEGLEAYAHGQGSLGMIGPTKQTKNLILSRKLRHAGHPVMDWMMNNVVVHPGDNKEYPMRDKSKDKIDGPVAMIMGVGRAVMKPAKKQSIYETRGATVV